MSDAEGIGIRLTGGPYAHTNIYPWAWPPPEQIVALRVAGKVAVAEVAHLAEARALDPQATVYRKVAQSALPARPESRHIVRGAQYEAEEVTDA